MNILHLIDLTAREEEPLLCCRAALDADGLHRVAALGHAEDARRAESLGLRITDLVPPMAPFAEAAAPRLRRLLGERDGRSSARPWADVVQCWSVPMLGLARLGSGKRTPPRVGALLRPRTPVDSIAGGVLRAKREVYALHDTTLFATDSAVRSSWAEPASARRGGKLLELNIRLLTHPGSGGRRLSTGPDRQIQRAAIGLQPEDIAIVLLADPPAAADAARFAFTLGLLYTTGARVVGIVPRGVGDERRALRFVRSHGRRWGLTVFEGSLLGAVRAADIALWDATDGDDGRVSAGPGLIRWARDAGVPVACASHPSAAQALGPRASVCMGRDRSPSALADRLLHLISHRHEPAPEPPQGAPGSSFADDLVSLWGETANVPVVRPGLPMPTALLRPT